MPVTDIRMNPSTKMLNSISTSVNPAVGFLRLRVLIGNYRLEVRYVVSVTELSLLPEV